MDIYVADNIIRRLLEARERGKQVQLSKDEIRQLCLNSSNIFLGEPCLLQLKAPIMIAGDIHGQYGDLFRMFEGCGYPPEVNYLFLGNYIDFGTQSLETMSLLLAFKVRYPDNIFLLRGNHEDAKMNRVHGFYDECMRRYNIKLWKLFQDCFNCLPVAALIAGKILCIHGGLSPDLHNLAEIEHIERPTDIPDEGFLFDLLWSQPNCISDGWGKEMISEVCDEEVVDGSISITTFGEDKLMEFLVNNDLDLLCRGNQVKKDGYEFFAKRRLVTIFSAPNFRDKYDNAGGLLHVDENLVSAFEIFMPRKITTMSENSTAVNSSTSKAASKNKSSFGWMNISKFGRSNATNKPESSQGVNPSKSSTNTANNRSKSPEIKVAGTSKPDSGSGTGRTEPESKPGTNTSKSGLYRSESPGVKGGGLERLLDEEREQRNELEEDLSKKNEELRVMSLEKSSLQEEIERLRHQVAELSKKNEELWVMSLEKSSLQEEIECLRHQVAEMTSSGANISKFFADFSVMEIKEATNNFHESMVIGEGGYGKAYKGFLQYTKVAIKVPKAGSSQGFQEFNQEVEVLSRLRHPNIVTLIGVCSEASALIYEYVPRGSLEDRLSCKDDSPPLPWKTRIRIACELCCVLIFLQSSKPETIVHGDLKPANVLLDANLSCKLSDFGICRSLMSTANNNTLIYMTAPKGTLAYIDPIFLGTGELTPKSDVYSYGIILLQLLMGKPGMNIRSAVLDAFKKGTFHEMLDASAGEWPLNLAIHLAKVALGCCEINRRDRPDIGAVWEALTSLGLSKTV